MKRVLLLGRGAAGKSTLARQLGERLHIPPTEIDKLFWTVDLEPLGRDEWITEQEELCRSDAWILDGDLGPYDILPIRLKHADTIILLDFPLITCMVRALKRSPERMDFWHWLITWSKRERPMIMDAINEHAPQAELIILKNQKEVDAFLAAN